MKRIGVALIVLVINLLTAHTQNLYFPPTTGDNWDTITPQSLGWCSNKIDSMYNFLEAKNTKAFVLLKDGKIVLEKYFGTQTQNSTWYWASAGKTLTAFLVGITQQENKLNISDKTSTYLGSGWTSCTTQQEDKITIRHQLTMTSGLDDGVTDPYCTLNSCLTYEADAGTRWAYHNGPYTLLDNVIENATGSTMNAYMNQKLKNATGMTGSFIKVDYNNVFFSTARSMARFGLLMLNKGNWNGTQLMTDSAYFGQMTRSSQTINPSYGYLWWLNGKSEYMLPSTQFTFNGLLNPSAPTDMIAALGKNGQFINVIPSKNMVWIRMGDAPDDSDVPFLLNDQIWGYLNSLQCNASSVRYLVSEQNSVTFIQDKLQNLIILKSNEQIETVNIVNELGQTLRTINVNNMGTQISTEKLTQRLFFLNIKLKNGKKIVKKLSR